MKELRNDEFKGVKVLAGIDALYYFLDNNTELYQKIYEMQKNSDEVICEYFKQFSNVDISYQGKSGGKNAFIGFWYSVKLNNIPLFRFGIKDPLKQQQVKNIFVQLDGCGIYAFGIKNQIEKVNSILNLFFDIDITLKDCILSKVDLNFFVAGYDKLLDIKDKNSFRSNLLKHEIDRFYGKGDSLKSQTLYLGSRSGSWLFRIYNKSVEILEKDTEFQASIKKDWFLKHGIDVEKQTVFNLEWSLKRGYLTNTSLNSIYDLFYTYAPKTLYGLILNMVVFLGFDIEFYKKQRKNNHISRLEAHPLWTYIFENFICVVDEINGSAESVEYFKKVSKPSIYCNLSRAIVSLKNCNEIENAPIFNDLIDSFEELRKKYISC